MSRRAAPSEAALARAIKAARAQGAIVGTIEIRPDGTLCLHLVDSLPAGKDAAAPRGEVNEWDEVLPKAGASH